MTLESLDGLVLVGAGRMGGALLDGWLENGLPPDKLTVIDPAPAPQVVERSKLHGFFLTPDSFKVSQAAIVVIAVKPQIFSDVLTNLCDLVGAQTLALSIAAGKTIADLENGLGHVGAVVRAMPNTPAAISRGVSVLVANSMLSQDQRFVASQLMSAVGTVEWIEDETLMDAVTALSGSGPAYVFHLTECLIKAGIAAGLDAGLSARLAAETVAGSGALITQSAETPERLRKNVTSPGGTTEAALKVLMSSAGLEELMIRAVLAAKQRGRELAG